ncbi:MAG TPA: ester cyclase [Kofleriaceae bacterium]|jgi:predicted ester cyclase|nr:ester cyclase [Kofleriaceae bacterium]
MDDDAAIAALAIRYFNGEDPNALDAVLSRRATVHASIGDELELVQLEEEGLPRLATVLRELRVAFPDVRFALGAVRVDADDVKLEWTARGTHRGPLLHVAATERPVELAGRARLQLAGGKVTDLWWDFDLYGALLQLGAIGAEPGVGEPRAVAVAKAAAAEVRAAILARHTAVDVLGPTVAFHGRVRVYLSQSFDDKTFAFVGAGRAGELFACLVELFDEVGELSLDDGISQGATTTFRGKLRARRRRDFYSYRFRMSLRAGASQVTEAWIEVTPPATVMEVIQ